MRITCTTLVLLAACPSAASAEPCRVTIAHAPAELRATIEGAVSNESNCRVALELRIVPTEGGYYLLARDLHGRTRERIVPDAASATTLVTSWMADDELDDTDQRPQLRIAALPPPPAPEPIVVATVAAPPPPPHRTALALYGVIGPDGAGWRADLDVAHRGPWSLGISAARMSPAGRLTDDDGSPDVNLELAIVATEYDLLGYVSYRRDLSDAWHLRGALGVGAAIIDVTFEDAGDPTTGPVFAGGGLTAGSGGLVTAPLVEGLFAIDADLTDGLSLVAGVKVDGYIESPVLTFPFAQYDNGHAAFDRSVTWSLLGGLRYEL
jgi:hypothetical protein